MNNKSLVFLMGSLIILLVAFSSLFVVTEYQRAVMLEFGRLVDADLKNVSGLTVEEDFVVVVAVAVEEL